MCFLRLLPLWLGILAFASCASSSGSRRGLFDYNTSALPTDGWESPSAGECTSLATADRRRLLEIADPANYPNTRYRHGPRRALEKETDCSHFVHEVYRRAGLTFSFRSSRGLKEAPEFELLPESEAKPGDLMLFRGHVGIVDEEGKIISATKTKGKAKSSITRLNRDAFRPIRGALPVLRYRCRPPVRQIAQER
jgi:hypothetical protein